MSYGIYSGTFYEASNLSTVKAAKLDALKISASRKSPVFVVQEEDAPDKHNVIAAPSSSGWVARCHGNRWIEDPEFRLIIEQERHVYYNDFDSTQIWHRKHARGEGRNDPLGGFRVWCENEQGHAQEDHRTPCFVSTPGGGRIEWNWYDNVLFTIQAAWEVKGVR